MRKRVYIAHTGGTIGMRKTSQGYAPSPGFLEEQMRQVPELGEEAVPLYVIQDFDPLLDSANMTPEDWLGIARDIASRYDEFDGFIVLHGTDTMAYTASALSFLLGGLTKPVIVTGSQIPLCELRSDGRDNLLGALMIAGGHPIPEVCLYFNHKLLRGNRSVKIDADGFGAFDSPNFPPLGRTAVQIEINWDLVLRPDPNQRLAAPELERPAVGALRLFPGIPAEMVANVLRPPIAGLVLEAFGVGNGPEQRPILEALSEATQRGVVVVDCTQCLKGAVRLDEYATGSGLARAGVISGFDLTVEAALTKLFFLLDGRRSPESVRRLMGTSLRGELTAQSTSSEGRPGVSE